jgi:Fe-S oxidoreductase
MELARKFYLCTECENCTKSCPSAIEVVSIVEAARVKLVEDGFMPEEHKAVVANIEKAANPFGSKPEERTNVYPKDKRAEYAGAEPPKKTEVLLFMGCTSAYLDMKVIPSLFVVLDAAGVSYAALGDKETCCGLPLEIAGAKNAFKETAGRTAAMIKETNPKVVVTPCAGCYKTLRDVYPKVVEGWDVKVLSLVEYVEELLESGKLVLEKEVKEKVAYHDPCHLGRQMGVFDAPRNVLRKVSGLELVEFPTSRELSSCCGGGGGVPVLEPDMAARISARRVRQALDAGAGTIVSACPFCKDQLKKGAARIPREEGRVRVMDIIEIIRKAVRKK